MLNKMFSIVNDLREPIYNKGQIGDFSKKRRKLQKTLDNYVVCIIYLWTMGQGED